MRKGRQIMEDHRAISITLTSILEHAPPLLPPKVPSGAGRCLNSCDCFSAGSYRHPPPPFPLTHLFFDTQQSHIWDHSCMHDWMMIISVYSPNLLPHVATRLNTVTSDSGSILAHSVVFAFFNVFFITMHVHCIFRLGCLFELSSDF